MSALLLAGAAGLGALAFFEPCTVATHTLHTARAHVLTPARRWRDLFLVWAPRAALAAGLLALVTGATPAPAWGGWLPSGILTVMASVYLISRRVYLPVPHLAFHRLWPGGGRLPEAVRLGLTLPACTLPLFLVLAGLAASADSPALAAAAGVLFATFFTLPMAWATFHGVGAEERALLDQAARSSPWLTALLLYCAALMLLVPALEFDPDTLAAALEQADTAGLLLAFLAGLVFSFNPVSFAAIPFVLAYVTRAGTPRRVLVQGGAFIAGMILAHVVLGVAAALGGDWAGTILGRHWGLALGPLLILLGLLWPGWLKLRLPWIGLRGRKVAGAGGAFLLGVPFAVAVCPFCAPALLVVLTAAAAIGSAPYGFALLLAFSLGRAVPIALGAWGMGRLEALKGLARHQKGLEVVAGLTLIATGLYLLNAYFFWFR